jgi:hypothetical protein
MNERITELANQADREGNQYGRIYMDYGKFAELIIKECIKVLETNDANLTSDFKWDAIYEIEQYFGVKE